MKSLQLQKPFGTSDVLAASLHSTTPLRDSVTRIACSAQDVGTPGTDKIAE